MPARVEVEFDIFSGMPNPVWSLTDAEAASFISRLATLRAVPAVTLSGRLGYRGFIVQVKSEDATQWVRVQNGIVQSTKDATEVYRHDAGRTLERWLLDTGRPHLEAELFEIARREIQ